jgi:hypothetical protein
MSNYQIASALYRSLGWEEVVPAREAPESKKPLEGIRNVFGREGKATQAQMDGWEHNFPTRNCLLKMPPGVIGIDVDHYDKVTKDRIIRKRGYDSLLRDIVRFGDLPPTFSSTSRGAEQPSRILFFRVTPGSEFHPEPYEDVEIIQRHHRYAVVYPSIHPDTKRQYFWYNPSGRACTPPRPSDISELPQEWYAPLQSSQKISKASRSRTGLQTPSTRIPYSGSPQDWLDCLDDGEMSWGMAIFYSEFLNRSEPHIGHVELLTLIGRLHWLAFDARETGAREVFEAISGTYLALTNEPNPELELGNIIRYVAGEGFSPCQK